MHVIMDMSPYIVAVLKLKTCRIPEGSLSSNIIVSIADHKHIFFAWGIILKNHQSLLCEVYGNRSYETAFLCEHIIILYLLCVEIVVYDAQLYIEV